MKDSSDYKAREYSDTMSQLLIQPISDMRSEQDILQERIEKHLMAFGEFNSDDLMRNSINPDDFLSLESNSNS